MSDVYYSSDEEYYKDLERQEAEYNVAMEDAQFGLPPSEWAEADAEWDRLEKMQAVMKEIESLRTGAEERWRRYKTEDRLVGDFSVQAK